MLPLIPVAVPILGALLLYPVLGGRKENRCRKVFAYCTAVCAATLGVLALLLWQAARGTLSGLDSLSLCGERLRMRCDGFRALYAMIAGVMWTVTSAFSSGYFAHEPEHADRYVFFILLTFGATVGLMLSDSLFTAFVFFEVMSMASCPWVAHEETPGAMRAAQTYLYVAVIGGLVMLMGILLLPGKLAQLPFSALSGAAGGRDLLLPALLILFGFGAKAGAFPLHIWLPKAHPVAPAPASALLSGLLTKAGLFGVLVLCCRLMRFTPAFGKTVFFLGTVTMLLGALLAVFSTNLKRTLACSSLSQVGFILIGCGILGITGAQNALAAFGTVQHMVNHSLFKLVLFLCAGVAAMNAHTLKLEELRGFGRGKPMLHFCFLMGMLGISGVPGFSGYISKSMLHEGLLELIAELAAEGESTLWYSVAEKLFIVSGGMTLCYMLKLYLCLFWQKPASPKFTQPGGDFSRSVGVLMVLCACLIPLFGLMPGMFMTGLGKLSRGFFGAPLPHHLPVPYFSGENLLGAAKSVLIGLVLYALNVRFVMNRLPDGSRGYPDRLPVWLDMENSLYRPALRVLCAVGGSVGLLIDRAPDAAIAGLRWTGGKLAGLLSAAGDTAVRLGDEAFSGAAILLDRLGDSLALLLHRHVLPTLRPREEAPVGDRFTYRLGLILDRLSPQKKKDRHCEAALAAAREESGKRIRQMTRSVGFGLLLFCIGLIAALLFLLQ